MLMAELDDITKLDDDDIDLLDEEIWWIIYIAINK